MAETLIAPPEGAAARHRPRARILTPAEFVLWQEADATRAQAAAELERARAEVAALRAEARDAGLAEGRGEAANRLAEALAAWQRRADEALAGIEPALAETVVRLVERVVGTLDVGERVERLAATAVAELRRGLCVTVTVHPDILPALRARLPGLLGDAWDASRITLAADPAAAPEDCLLSGEFGVVDAGLEAQMAALRAGMAAALREGGT